ncbi:hypothetical protein RHRU231_450234 [Rhodococcus ruber]|uniref:Uncharacterized protein n=1 Tax=Rhodococcus ruber TaxID=1830 RepID=A0A098BLJ0_9NOCA|nr:hypothetical protein RHRU231_450234 [Rhodococcus ruber]
MERLPTRMTITRIQCRRIPGSIDVVRVPQNRCAIQTRRTHVPSPVPAWKIVREHPHPTGFNRSDQGAHVLNRTASAGILVVQLNRNRRVAKVRQQRISLTIHIDVVAGKMVASEQAGEALAHLLARTRPVRVTVAVTLSNLVRGKGKPFTLRRTKIKVALMVRNIDSVEGHRNGPISCSRISRQRSTRGLAVGAGPGASSGYAAPASIGTGSRRFEPGCAHV